MRDRDGSEHTLLMRQGRVVGARVAGRFDPLLRRLRTRGDLAGEDLLRVLEALGASERRCGQLAGEVTGVGGAAVRRALEEQLTERILEVLECATHRGLDARFVARPVSPAEACATVAWESLLPDEAPAPRRRRRAVPTQLPVDRRALRKLALRLHPDRNGHLPPNERAAFAARLAEATALFHGLR